MKCSLTKTVNDVCHLSQFCCPPDVVSVVLDIYDKLSSLAPPLPLICPSAFTLLFMMSHTETVVPSSVSVQAWAECLTRLRHCAKKPVTTMLTYPWKCTVLHCNHLGNTWKPLVLMTQHFDYHPR